LKKTFSLRVGECVIKFRWPILVATAIFTALMAYEANYLDIKTLFPDLIPPKHPFVANALKYQKAFGGANQVTIQLRANQGTIFNIETLQKLWDLQEDCQFLPCVDKYKVISLAAKKIKNIKVTDWGIEAPAMMKTVPGNQKDLSALEDAVVKNDTIYGSLVSVDKTSALVIVDFFEDKIDYLKIFNALQELKKKYKDAKHDVSMAGFPLVFGYVTNYLGQTFYIMLGILGVVAIFLYLTVRSIQGTMIPIISGCLCWLWGLGIMSMVGYNLDPLVIVLPFIIMLMAIRHSVQVFKRFEELYLEPGGPCQSDKKAAAVHTIGELFSPAALGIICEAAGILLVAWAPFAMLRKVSYTATVWSMLALATACVLTPIYLVFARPRKTPRKRDVLDSFMDWSGKVAADKRVRYWLVAAWIILLFAGVAYSRGHLLIGETRPGTSILWPKDDYNVDLAQMDIHFPGMLNPLAIYFEGKEFESLKEPESLYRMTDFQKQMEMSPYVTKSHSIIDLIRRVSMTFHEDHPKWESLPETKIDVGQMLLVLTYGGAEPGDFDRYFDWSYKDSNFIVFLSDQKGETLRKTVEDARKYLPEINQRTSTGQFVLAGGPMGVLAGTNEELKKARPIIMEAIVLFIFLATIIAYRSFVAGFVVCLPLVISNFIVYSYMNFNLLGLTVATIPVCAIGLGAGVDFIYYIVSRIKDDYAVFGNMEKSIQNCVETTGRAVFILGLTLCIGVMAWRFSSLMFQAQMGFLIGFVLVINLVNAIFFVPSLIAIIRPKFITKGFRRPLTPLE
jgi:uncharacterized protein